MERGGWLLTILLVILLLVAGLWTYDYYHFPKPQPKLASFLRTVQSNVVLVVDMNENNRVSLPEVLKGQDALLVIHQGNDPVSHENDTVFASDVVLAIFDRNHDGRIDANDPVYRRLELKYFNPTTGMASYVPISEAGIRAIFIDPKYYAKEDVLPPDDPIPHPVGTVIMSDSTARLVRQMRVHETYINNQQKATTSKTGKKR